MKVGIIGASFAKAAFLPALRHVEGVEVVAIASARADSAAAAAIGGACWTRIGSIWSASPRRRRSMRR
jgi:predicted dehydrogenase